MGADKEEEEAVGRAGDVNMQTRGHRNEENGEDAHICGILLLHDFSLK